MKRDRRLLFKAVPLIIIIILFGCDAIPKRHFESAEKMWTDGDYKGALREYEKIIEDYPTSTVADDAYYWMGITYYLSLNKADDALNAFLNLVNKYPGSEYFFQSQMYIAELYGKKENYKQAIIEYQKVAEHSRDKELIEKARYNIAEAYFKLGDLNQARIEWDLQISQSPDGKHAEEASYRVAKTYFIQGRYQEAIEAYQKFLKRYPESKLLHDVRFAIANCLEEQENLQEALQMYKKIELDYPNREVVAKKIAVLQKRMVKE